MSAPTNSSRPALVFAEQCREHDTGPAHPECNSRLDWVIQALADAEMNDRFVWHRPEPVELSWIETVHTADYVRFIEQACLEGRPFADQGETMLCVDSFDAARRAAGGALLAVDLVMEGKAPSAFSLARPPGHHARPGQAMGFCLFNNVAIAARYAQQRHGVTRVAILDWDVHHGNGTQEMFYGDPSVHFTSLHEAPLYPFTGNRHEVGIGAGEGFNLNCPVSSGARFEAYQEAWENEIRPAWEQFRPELILLSAGFDAHACDPLAHVLLEAEDFATMTDWICAEAQRWCGGRVVSLLEGGYDRLGMSASAVAHVRQLAVAAENAAGPADVT